MEGPKCLGYLVVRTYVRTYDRQTHWLEDMVVIPAKSKRARARVCVCVYICYE